MSSTWCFSVSRLILGNSHYWKAKFVVLSSATFLMACTSSENQRPSQFWRFCTCIESLICGRAVIDGPKNRKDIRTVLIYIQLPNREGRGGSPDDRLF